MGNTKTKQDIRSPLPLLSVVVVTVYNSRYLRQCLTALKEQIDAPALEIIVVYHQDVKGIPEIKKLFPSVRFYFIPGRQTQDSLRAFGVSKARSNLVTITVDHCTPDRYWCAGIMNAHKGPHAAVGGAIEKGEQPDTLVNWAVHIYDYCNYGYYMNPVYGGPARDLSDCNTSYKKKALSECSHLWTDKFNVALLNKALLDRGESLWISPDLIVYQNRDIDLGKACSIAFRRGRAFASARLSGSTPDQRLVYALFSPFLPLMLLNRLITNINSKRSKIDIMFRVFVLIGMFSILWSWGELLGYFTGRRDVSISVAEE